MSLLHFYYLPFCCQNQYLITKTDVQEFSPFSQIGLQSQDFHIDSQQHSCKHPEINVKRLYYMKCSYQNQTTCKNYKPEQTQEQYKYKWRCLML